ncbi:hypothetical protein F4859DRAFT_475723, partial [Xylaria cf. heliscus]
IFFCFVFLFSARASRPCFTRIRVRRERTPWLHSSYDDVSGICISRIHATYINTSNHILPRGRLRTYIQTCIHTYTTSDLHIYIY